jgi:hypothetical protein
VVALRSLAAHVDAPYEDVVAHYAESGDLSAFFVRSDNRQPAPVIAQPSQPNPKSGRQLQLEMTRRRTGDEMKRTPHQLISELQRRQIAMEDGGSAFEDRTLTGREALALLARRAPNSEFVDWHPGQQ